MVNTLGAAVTTRGVGACREFVYAEGNVIPVILELVANYGQYCCHGVMYTFDAAVTTREVGACCEFVYNDKFVSGCRQLGAACSQSQWM